MSFRLCRALRHISKAGFDMAGEERMWREVVQHKHYWFVKRVS